MEDHDPPPSEKSSQEENKPQSQHEQQQLQLESGVVSLPSPLDRSQQPSKADPFDDDWEQAPRSKRKKMSSSPPPSPSAPVEKDHHQDEMSEEQDSDSDDEDNSSNNIADSVSSKNDTPVKKDSPQKSNPSQRFHRQRKERKHQDLAKVPRRAEFPVVVRDVRGGSATLQGLGPSKREKALTNHIGPFQWTMGFRREGQFMVACRDKHQQTKLANTTSLLLGPGVKIYIECSIPSPHTEGVIKGIPLDESISKEDIKVLVNGNEMSNLVSDVQRLKRRDGQLSKALRLKFATENLPEEVIICRSLYHVTAYVANPIRCSKCNSFGHHRSVCKEEEQTCPRCGSTGHDARSCNGLKYCKNCKVEGHSAAYSGCPFYKQLKKANQIRATTWMPHHEAFKRASESYTHQESSHSKDTYLGAELSLQTYSQAAKQNKKQDSKQVPLTRKQTPTNVQSKSHHAKVQHRLHLENETPQNGDKSEETPTEAPSNGSDSESVNENSNTNESINKISASQDKEETKKPKKDNSSSADNKTDKTMCEILKRLDDMAKRQEKQEKETASLRDSLEQEKARRIEAEKKFTNLNIKALQQQQRDSRKTSALKEIFSFILQSINSGKTGSAVAGNLDAILSKYMIDDGHQAFIGNQLKAAGEFIARKDSLSEENIFSLTEFISKK